MICILYVNAVGLCLGLVALFLERTMPATSPRRWIWLVIIPISMAIPGFYRVHHSWSIVDAFEQQSAQPPLGHAIGTASRTVLDPDLWTTVQSYDSSINRLWLTISAFLLLSALASAWRVSRAVGLFRRGRANGTAIVDGVPVVVTDLLGPATVGFWRSRVLLPRWVLALPEVQRQYVVRHEEEHRSAHDGRVLFVASLSLILTPWNLALWWQLRRLCLAMEMDCDSRVVARLGDANVYGALLLKIAEASSRGPRLQPALLGGVGTLERRLTMLLAPTPLRHVQRFLLPALAFGLLVVVLKMPHPVLGPESHAPATMTSAATTAPTHHTTPATEGIASPR
jgi:beta-lactamase regulating signal transducer with metallopeptidase domain